MYGTRLTRDFGVLVPEPWASAIRTLNDRQIQRGMRKLIDIGSTSTPTLPAFVKACRMLDDEDERPGRANVPALPGYDDYHLLGQRWLFAFLLKQGGVGPEKLPKLIAAKNRIVEQFRAGGDIDGTVAEWLDVAMSTFEREAA